MKAVDVLKVEIDRCARNRLMGNTDRSLTVALGSMLRHLEYVEKGRRPDWVDSAKGITIDRLIERLSDPLFVDQVRNLGQKSAKRLIVHFKESNPKEPNPGGWG